jgi:hypothetical protein
MELRKLRYFVAAAEAGSFRGAAARLGTQQPTISQHMQKLEDRLNTDLFERHARGARLIFAASPPQPGWRRRSYDRRRMAGRRDSNPVANLLNKQPFSNP